MWCPQCARNCPTVFQDLFLCCSICGKIIIQETYSEEVTFFKNAAGQSQLSGRFVKTVQSDYSISRERTLARAQEDLNHMADCMEMGSVDAMVRQALAFYTIAVERNFTRGRKTEQVEAACLYIACREKKKPYLLIDFSEHLRTNVYVLGSVFLQLCKLLRLEEHPIVQNPIDPSLFIHKFTARLGLPGETNLHISRTALHIIASMKRDWMQTGRKPSGLCGAALYISALSHDLKCSKSDIVKIVHICEATLTKRLIEFENTESGTLTIEEFNVKAAELEKYNCWIREPEISLGTSVINELLCEHKGSKKSHFAHGLCEDCYNDFIKLSGGLNGGSDPPAFQRAEMERMMKASSKENSNDLCKKRGSEPLEFVNGRDCPEVVRNEKFNCTASSAENGCLDGAAFDRSDKVDGRRSKTSDESESLSDIDDIEVDGYLHNEEETHYKKIIWEKMNWEYVEEQAAKEAAAAATKNAFEANYENCPEDIRAAQELAAAAAAAVEKSRKEKKEKRAADAKKLTPAQTAAEAARQMLTRKRLSSKINFDVLDKLFDEPTAFESAKKIRSESHNDEHGEKVSSNDKCKKGEYDDEELAGGASYNNVCQNAEDGDEVYDYGADYCYDDGDYYGYDGF